MGQNKRPNVVFLMMLVGFLALIAALWGGLLRLGWRWPVGITTWPTFHGPLMVSGFLGTLISLERAVGIRRRWALLAPLMSAIGAFLLIVGMPQPLASVWILIASLLLVGVFIFVTVRHPALHFLLMGGGAFSWSVGNLLWSLGWPIPKVVPWWMGFFVLTIVGERLELSRLFALSRRKVLPLMGFSGIVGLGMGISLFHLALGERLVGVGLVGLALWLLRHDIALHALRAQVQIRYTAGCMLSGYGWLLVAGVWFLMDAGAMAGPSYDAPLHAVFLGFVFSMIFGHALIIIPALTGIRVPYHPRFYIPLVLLHLSLIFRVLADGGHALAIRRWAGLTNAAAILLFILLLIYTSRVSSSSQR